MSLDKPLSDSEFDELDNFLMSKAVGDDGMTMDALHGYLTAIAIGPEFIPLSEWLPNVWGLEGAQPKFSSEKQSERIINLIARFMNEILIIFEVAPKEFEPLFCIQELEGKEIIDGETWAWGFWEGMQLRADAWEQLNQSPLAPLLHPIYLLGANEISGEETELVNDPVKCHKLAIEVEAAIPHLHQYWLSKRTSEVTTFRRDGPKQGRNEICNCGSGKKYKDCCGTGPTIH
ncbi:MAG: YecA family protein [Solimicrobium sp.]|jgi:uncharacterized protein|nr:YecA family protein [Solimicrobium sp.]